MAFGVSRVLSTAKMHGGVLRLNSILARGLNNGVIWTRFPTWRSPNLFISMTTDAIVLARNASTLGQISVRFVHDTKKKDSTTLVTSDKSSMAFHKMSLNTLKNECRSRGLKVSGRKAELVSRIVSNQGLNEMSFVTHEGSSSFPKKRTIYTSKGANFKSDQTISEVPKKIKQHTSNTITSLKIDASKNTQKASELRFAESNTVTNKTSIGADQAIIPEYVIGARDKRFFFGFVTFVSIWWSSQYINDRAQ